MTAKNHLTIHNVEYQQLPKAWIRKMGLDPQEAVENRFDVTLKIVPKPQKPQAPFEQIKRLATELQNLPDINPDFDEADMYDEVGLPK